MPANKSDLAKREAYATGISGPNFVAASSIDQFAACKLTAAGLAEMCATTDTDADIDGFALVPAQAGESVQLARSIEGAFPFLSDGASAITTSDQLALSSTVAGRLTVSSSGSFCASCAVPATVDTIGRAFISLAGGGGGGGGAITLTSDAQGATPLSALTLQNTTPATLAIPVQTSPAFEFIGSAWDTDDLVAREVTIRGYLLPTSAASPYPRLVITRTIDGGAETVIFQMAEQYIGGASWDLTSRQIDLANLTLASPTGAANPQLASASANVIADSAVGARLGFAAREVVWTAQSPDNGGYLAVNGVIAVSRGAALVVTANTIAPTAAIHHVGAGLIKTITPIAGTGARTFEGTLVLIPDAAFTWDATGNIAVAGLAVVNKALHMTYDANAALWYPSYV